MFAIVDRAGRASEVKYIVDFAAVKGLADISFQKFKAAVVL